LQPFAPKSFVLLNIRQRDPDLPFPKAMKPDSLAVCRPTSQTTLLNVSQEKDILCNQAVDNLTVDDLSGSPRMAYFVVSSRSPFRIVSVSSGFTELIDFCEDELLGRSLAILRGPETDTPTLHGAIKAVETNPQTNVQVTLYGRTGDSRRLTASFTAALDCDGQAIGCNITVRPQDGEPAATPTTPLDPHLSSDCAPGTRLQLRGAGLDSAGERRRRHNLYVGLLLESEAGASAQTPAARLQEEAVLCQLLATA
jgi:hypothetical protein